eukprot:gene21758-27814_t
MIEHSFYQAVNLIQVLYLHAMSHEFNDSVRLLMLLLVTSPWLLRDLFPVNRFSDNYVKQDDKSTSFIRILYRIKKYQYVFYKHFLLHGLNITVALDPNISSIATDSYFRTYWLLLNTAYVMEFFLQTLVKKGRMSQSRMLFMQQLLMVASSLAALSVLAHVNWWAAAVSLALNFLHRKHDVLNTAGIAATFYLIQRWFEAYWP